MKVAAVGAGNWGKNIVRALDELGHLLCVVEPDPDKAKDIKYLYPSTRFYTDLTPVLDSEAEAVTIASPAATHFELAKKALEAGKHVFVEKPLTLSSLEGQELVDLAKAKGVVLMVGHLLLYQPAMKFIKESLDSGLIGEAKIFHQQRLNLGRARNTENVLWSLGVHDIAVLLYLIKGKPTDVGAGGQAVLQPNIEDDFYLHILFDSGQHAHLHCSWLWPETSRRLTIVGTTGMLVFDEASRDVVLHRKTIDANLKNVDLGFEPVFTGSDQPLRIEIEHFIKCCETGQKPISDGESAVQVLKVMELASRSLVTA